jgi:hypothetical protein
MSLIEQINLVENKINELRKNGIIEAFDLEIEIIKLYPDFYEEYPTIVKMFCRDTNVDKNMLYKLISLSQDIKDGNKSTIEVETKLGNELAEQYLYPVVNKENSK